jgi:flavin-dependent dehydrogenase
MRFWDVAVIGGGPAGSTAARLLAAWGHSVALIAKAPRRITLGESLPPSCRKLFDRAGLTDAIDAAGFLRTSGNTVRWGSGSRVEAFAPGALGYQVVRGEFDSLLLDQAHAVGAAVRRGAVARGVKLRADGDGRSRVTVEHAGQRDDILARWVLDCSGRRGVVARRGWRRVETGKRTLALVTVWERTSDWPLRDPTHTLVESYADGWGWSVPVGPERRYVTVMVDPEITPPGGKSRLRARFDAELAKTSVLSELTAGAARTTGPWAFEASPYGAERVAEPGVLLVGDAASFIDPLSSFGVKKAMASAWLAAVVTHSALSDEPVTGAALDLYERREREMYAALESSAARFAREAFGAHAGPYWRERAEADDQADAADLDTNALREDPTVLAALADLKQRPAIRLRQARAVRHEPRPLVIGNRVALEGHLVSPAFPGGIRYLRGIDLVRLADLAPEFEQVPDLFEAYNRACPPVALPDFLGALSLLLARRVLEHA